MRIGIDFDGVVCDTIAAMISYAASRHGLTLSLLDCIAADGPAGLSVEHYVQLIEDTHRTDYAMEMQPIAGAIEALTGLAATHDLFIITARREAAFENARRWSEQYGLTAHIEEFVSASGTSKAALSESLRLHALIDDFPRNLEGFPATTLPILWHAEYNADVAITPPMVRVRGWLELQEHLEALH